MPHVEVCGFNRNGICERYYDHCAEPYNVCDAITLQELNDLCDHDVMGFSDFEPEYGVWFRACNSCANDSCTLSTVCLSCEDTSNWEPKE